MPRGRVRPSRRWNVSPPRRVGGAVVSLLAVALAYGCVEREVITVTIGSITVQPSNASLIEGDSLQFQATVTDENGRTLPRASVEWTSEAPEKLSIDADGMGRAIEEDTILIQASFRGVVGTAEVIIIPAPDVTLEPTTAALRGAAGAPSPAPIDIDVRNGGGSNIRGLTATVAYASGQPTDWLTASLDTDRTPATLTLTAVTTTLAIGVYDATVTVASPDDRTGPAVLPVTLSLTGLTVTETGGGTLVTEAGGTDSVSVVLDAAPVSDVALTVTSADEGEVTVSPATLTFSPDDWNVPQWVVLTGQDEVTSDGNQVTQVTIAVDDDASDDSFDPIPDRAVDVTTIDDDAPSFRLTQSGAGTEVTEAGTTDQFTVVLDVEPLTPVVFDVAPRDPTEVSAGPTTLTFTGADWATPQTVTVTGVNDALIDGDAQTAVVVSVNAGTSDDAWDVLAPDSVIVTTRDDDSAGLTLRQTAPPGPGQDSTWVGEDGSTDQFTVALDAQPVEDVVLSVTSADPGETTVAPSVLVFTAGNWSVPQTVTVTGVDDDLLDGDQSTLVTVAVDAANSDDQFDAVSPGTVLVTTGDDDDADVVVTQSGGGSQVTEAGSTDDFSVVLTAEPLVDVVVDVTSTNAGEVTVAPVRLTFTPTDWDTPQQVTLTGVDEDIDDGDRITPVTIVVDAAASDDDFDALPPDTVLVTTVDDDTAGLTIVETAGGTLVTEAGGTDDFTVRLTSQPVDSVVLTLTASDPGEATISANTLTFRASNWDQEQTITVTGEDDLEDDEDQFSIIVIAVLESLSDDAYDALPDRTVQVTTTDNDSPSGFTITEIGGTIVFENGADDDFTVRLDTEPASDVVLDITSSDTGEAVVGPTSLTFTPANWNVPQTVTVTAADDFLIDGPQTTTVTVAVDNAGSDDAFDPLPDQTLSVTTNDDDVAGFTVTESGGSTVVSEGGTTDSLTVVLDAQPTSDVVISVTSGDEGEATVAPSTLIFQAGSWNVAQTVTVTGFDDPVLDGSQTTTVTLAVVGGSSDNDFDAVADQTVDVTTTDNDQPGVTAVISGANTIVTEAAGTDDFTVVLDAQPASDVVIDVSSSDPGEVTALPAVLPFTPANWSTPQAVVVTGVDDDVIDGDQTSTITAAVRNGASDPPYADLFAAVSVVTTDDDGAGITVVGGPFTLAEGGTSGQFTVALDAQPASAVVLEVTSSDPSEAVVSPSQLTFTFGDWNTPQPVTVTGVDDDLIDGDQPSTITVSVNQAQSDDAFDGLADILVSATTTDDDGAFFTVAQTNGGTLVAESGGLDSITVVLGAQPDAGQSVTFDLATSDAGEAQPTPTGLTFDDANWNVPQTVTITGVDDALIDGDQLSTITVAVGAGSDPNFATLADQTLSVTTADDDAAGFAVTQTGGSTSVTEAGTTDVINIVLNSRPDVPVTLNIVSADVGEATVSQPSVTFSADAGDWNTPRAITITGIDDLVDDGDQNTTATVSVAPGSDPNFTGLAAQIVTVVTVDDDQAGFQIAQTGGGTLVTESGVTPTDQFSVVLLTQPAAGVVLNVSSADVGEATVTPPNLAFDDTNWSTPQTVTVTGVDDLEDDGDQFTAVTIAVDPDLSDAAYDPLPAQSVTVTTTDDDEAANFTLTAIGGTSVTEAGANDNFQVVLDAEPATDIVLDIAVDDPTEVAVDQATVTFTPADWDTPQIVAVLGVDDDIIDGLVASTITVSVGAGAPAPWNGLPPQTLPVTTADDDAAGFTVTQSGGSTVVNEAGGTDEIDVVLVAQPASDVVITVTSADPGEATVNPAVLTFTPGNWSTPQTVTVTGFDDADVDGPQVTTITFSVDDDDSDDDFDPLPDQTVQVTTTDNDASGIAVTASGGSTTVSEAGTTDDFTVVLSSGPGTDVVLTVGSADLGEATVAPTTLTFTPADWDTPQTVTVTGVDDALQDGDQVTVVTVSVVDAQSDDAYDTVDPVTLNVTTTDDDGAGFTITESGPGTTVTEAGGTDDFTVVLDAQPATSVELTLTPSDPGEATVLPTTLVFTNSNWNTPRSVTVTGQNDQLIDGNQLSQITVSVDPSSDPVYLGVPDQQVGVTTLDDDLAGFVVQPTGGGTLVTEAGGTDGFSVVLQTEPTSDVVFDIASNDAGEAAATPATLTFTPANWSVPQVVTVTGVDDDIIDGSQLSDVTVTVDPALSDDDYDGVAPQSVSVTTTDDDAAGFTVQESGAGTSVSESGTTDGFTVVLDAQPASDVVLTVASGDTDEATVAPQTLTFTSATWSTPQTVTVTGVDELIDDGDQSTTITISVNDGASDDAFDGVANQTVLATTVDDDAAGITVAQTGGGTLVTEAGSTDDFTVVLDAQPLTDVVILVQSGDVGEATVAPPSLTFTSATWNVPQTVTVTGVDDLVDDGSQFTVVTISVDDGASDDAYDPVTNRTVTVTTTDDDEPVGVTVTQIGGTTVTEAGSTDDFTVVLDAQPSSDVVVDVTSADLGEAVVAPTALTFTTGNWSVPQTVTVTGVDDDLIDGPQVTVVTIAVNDAASDDAYDAVADQSVSVTTSDDDAAGMVVTQSGGSTAVNESGTTDGLTVVLTAEPVSDVVVTVTSSDTDEATVSPTTLTFTPATWNDPQAVTVTGADDDLIDGSQLSTVTIAIDQAASDDAFDAVPDETVDVTTTDDDAPGFSISESGGASSVDESGTTDDFTVVLTAEPASDVVLTVTSADLDEVTVAPSPLTFTPVNWNVPQAVTLTGIDDALNDGPQTTLVTVSVDDGLSDDAYDPLPDQTVSVTTTDDDAAGITLVESGGTTAVSEPGTSDSFTVVLDAQPSSAVVLTVSSADPGEAIVSTPTLTFSTLNWNVPQTVTVSAADDDLIDGPQVTLVTVSVDAALSDDAYDAVADLTVSVTTADDDIAGIEITETGGGTLVTEGGGTDTFSVVLLTEPATDVVLDVVSADPTEATAAPATLTFTGADWDVPQTVTITGVDDDLVDGSQATDVTVSVDDALSDAAYDGVADATVSVTTTDDDDAGFTVAETGGGTFVTEAGGTDGFTVVLDAQPSSDVVFSVTASDPSEATVSVTTLTFTPATWETPQQVTVTGVDDEIDDGNQPSTITISVVDGSSDDGFDSLADQTVLVTTADDDQAGFTIVQSGGSSVVSESGTTDDFTVVLDTEPTSDVVLTVTSTDAGEVTVAPLSLTFTTGNWSTPQTVTLTGVEDLLNDGTQITQVTVAVNDGPSDDAYDGVPDQNVSVATLDNDLAGFSIAQSGGGTSVSEAGTTDDFTVVLTAQPTTNVVMTITSADPSEATVAPISLTFTNGNWDTPQTVTVTGVDDDLDDGDRFTLVTVAIDDANSDDAFDPLADQSVSVTTLDDDGAGFTVVQTDGTTSVTEAAGAGNTDDFTVVLNAQPLTDVVLDLTSADLGEATLSTTTLTFTTGNWSTPQGVTVTGVDDDVDDGDVITQITVSVDDGASDDSYDAVQNQTFGVTTVDDDIAGFTIVQFGGATSVTEAAGAGNVDAFTVVLDAEPLTNVVLSVSSADTGEVTADPTTLTFTPAGWDTPQTVTVTGVDDAVDDGDQVTAITLAVVDGSSDDAFDSVDDQAVDVTTTDDDGAGFVVTESDGTTSVNESGTTDDFTVVLASEPTSNVVVDVSSGDTGEATVGTASLTFTTQNWDTPQAVLVTGVDDAIDDGDQVTQITVSIDAGASDDAFDALPAQTVDVTTVDDDAVGFTIVEFDGATTVNEAGATDSVSVVLDAEPSSDVVLTATSPDPGEVTAAPPTLTFTSGNWSTPQIVTLTGVDDDLTDGDIPTDVVVAVDDASSDDAFDGVADQTVTVTTLDDDVAGFVITESGPGTTVSESGTSDTFEVVLTSEPVADVVLDVVSAGTDEVTVDLATLTFTGADWSTPQTVTVTGVDDVVEDGDQITLVTISVNAAASDDDYDAVAAQGVSVTTTDDDTPSFTITETDGSTTVDETGTTDSFSVVLDVEPASDVVFDVTSTDIGEATVAPATLTFTPANWDTPQTVTVTGVDDATVDGTQNTIVTIAVNDAGSDDGFDPLADQTVTVSTTDDDIGSFSATESGGNTIVTEAGGTDDFTVVLDRQPLTPVVLTIASADPGEATVDLQALVFSAANWDTPRTITVTGVDDLVDDGDQPTTITIAVDDASSDDDFDDAPDVTVTATTTDDDAAGFTVVESGGTTSVSESGTTDQITVTLNARPISQVVLSVTSADTDELTVAPATLTFTPAGWNTPQAITVTGVDDGAIDGTQATDITISVVDASSDDAFDGVPDQVVSAETLDDDVAGFTVIEDGATTVSEAGTTDNFTVVLDAQPVSDVVLTVSSDNTDEATVDPASLTFTSGNWDTPQTVTVTGVDDFEADGDHVTTITISVDDANSDNAFDPLADQTVEAITLDDDVVGFTVAQSGGSTIVTEAGSSDDFTVVLNSQPPTDVVLTVTSGDTGEATVDVGTLTFTNGDWDTPQTVTVIGVNDAIDDDAQFTAITLSVDDGASDASYGDVADQTVTVTTTDDDVAGFSYVESGNGTLVTEAGSTDDFTVVLTAEPVTDVVLNVTSQDVEEVTVDVASLTFTNGNWSVPQQVTVTGVDDAYVDGLQFTGVTLSVDDAASDNAFDPLANQQVSVTTTDDDIAAYLVTESDGATAVDEPSGTDDFTIVLLARPVGDVVFDLSSDDTGEATVAPATVSFDDTNWDTPQTVTVTAADDDIIDGDQQSTITIAVNGPATDDAFDAMPDQTVAVTTTSDDVAGFTIVESGGATSVTEAAGAGNTDQFTVVLDAEPLTDVVIEVASADLDEATVAPSTLTFTPANWDAPQTVTVTGVDESVDDGDQTTDITVSVDPAASDDEFDLVAPQIVQATTVDDDAAGFTIVQLGGASTVTEAGGMDAFTVVLDAQPLTDVVLTVTSQDTEEVTVDQPTLTFTTVDWDQAQTVTLTGVDDDIADGPVTTDVVVAVDAGASDDAFDAVADQSVTVTTTDNDTAALIVAEFGPDTQVSEDLTTDSFSVVLATEPVSDVVIEIESLDTGEAAVAPATLTFTAGDWSTPQVVTVTGVDDGSLVDGPQTTTVTVSVNDAGSDPVYGALGDEAVTVTTTDNDVAGYQVTETTGNTEVGEDGSTDEISVVLTAQPETSVFFDVSSDDTGEAQVAPTVLTFTNADWSTPQVVAVTGVDDTPLVDGDQTTTVTVSVNETLSNNGFDLLAAQTVEVTTVDTDVPGFLVTEVNGEITTNEGGQIQAFDIALTAQPTADVVITVLNPDPSEIELTTDSVLTFTQANWSTLQQVQLVGVDDDLVDGAQVTTLTITVDDNASYDPWDAVNDTTILATTEDDEAAGFTVTAPGGTTNVDEDGPDAVDSLLVVLDAEPIDDVVLDVVSSDGTEATILPTTLTFTPANWNTEQVVEVTGVDDTPLADGNQTINVTISVNAAGSQDLFDGVGPDVQTVTVVDTDPATFTVSKSALTVDESGTTDDFTVVLDSEPLSNVVFSVSAGNPNEATVDLITLTFTPGNWSTPQTVTVTGVDDSVVDRAHVSTVTISVDEASSDDLFGGAPNQQVSVTTVDDEVPGITATPDGAGNTVDESGSTDNFTVVLDEEPAGTVVINVTSGDLGEVIVSSGAQLTFTPADWNVPQEVLVTGVDDPDPDGQQTTTITIAVDDGLSDDGYDGISVTQIVTTVDDENQQQ